MPVLSNLRSDFFAALREILLSIAKKSHLKLNNIYTILHCKRYNGVMLAGRKNRYATSLVCHPSFRGETDSQVYTIMADSRETVGNSMEHWEIVGNIRI